LEQIRLRFNFYASSCVALTLRRGDGHRKLRVIMKGLIFENLQCRNACTIRLLDSINVGNFK